MSDTPETLALEFTRALAARDYERAHSMTSPDYRRRVGGEAMREAFEAGVPPDWGATEPVAVVTTMEEWPEEEEGDVAWAYVGISGDVYSEALAVVVAREEGMLAIRAVEWGRP